MTDSETKKKHPKGKIEYLRQVIFEADTPLGKAFDLGLIVSIGLSIIVVMLDSMEDVQAQYGDWLLIAEWVFTINFSIEYLLRIICVRRPILYCRSFFGIVDLLSILPTYLSLLFPGTQYLTVIRSLRLLRIFRVLKLAKFIGDAHVITDALTASRRKIIVFLITVLTLVVILGSVMYVIEGKENGFTSIPRGIYWAVVTLTTVGYGDIAPKTVLGQIVASMVMICGYGIIAVPTGILTSEFTKASAKGVTTRCCRVCTTEGHEINAIYCNHCGAEL